MNEGKYKKTGGIFHTTNVIKSVSQTFGNSTLPVPSGSSHNCSSSAG